MRPKNSGDDYGDIAVIISTFSPATPYPTGRNPANMAKAAGSGEPGGLLTNLGEARNG
ncbi:hypothetical protein AA18889_1230 [Acetobacter senegalensis DSM 18889]|nr:hypothetical protein AA18889_1230 [Acetobacter senegalensis DSM 18889]